MGIQEDPPIHIKQDTREQKFKNFNWHFETFNDKTLEAMLSSAKEYVENIMAKKKITLTYSGPTGIGKTFLLERCYKLIKILDLHYIEKNGKILFITFYDATRKMFNNDDHFIYDVKTSCIMIMPEFLRQDFKVANARTPILIDMAHEILDMRQGMCNLIDTNKTLPDIEDIDKRIADRLLRNNGKFLNINKETKPFTLRKHVP